MHNQRVFIRHGLQVRASRGRVVSVYNPGSDFIIHLGGNKPDTTTAPPSTPDTTITTITLPSPIDTIVTADTGEILVITENGDTTTVRISPEGKITVIGPTGETTPIKGDEVTIVEPNGNTTVIDREGNIVSSGNNVPSASTEGPIAPYLTDFYLVFTVKNVPLKTMEFYYYSSKEIVDVNVVEKLRAVYSASLKNAGFISEDISMLKRSEGTVTENDELEVMNIQGRRIIKVGSNYNNTLYYEKDKQYSCQYQVNGSIETPISYNTTKISEDKTIALTVSKYGENDYKEALVLKVIKLQPHEYVITFDGKTYKNDDNLVFEKGKQNLLKLMEKEPSGNLKAPISNEVTWNGVKIAGSNEYNLTAQNDGKLAVEFTEGDKAIKLSFSYKAEEPFVPGITIDYDTKSDEYKYISNAQKKIKDKSSGMYTFIEQKSITIHVLPTKDGDTAGEAVWNNQSFPSQFKFDSKTLKFDESGCINNPIIIIQFVAKSEIDNLKVICLQGSIPKSALYQQIKLVNPDEIKDLEDFINSNRNNPTFKDELIKLKLFTIDGVFRAIPDDEIVASISDPLNGSITLYVDWLNDPSKSGLKTFLNPPSDNILIQYNYTRKLAHELMHLYYQANNKVEKAKWLIMRENTEESVFGTKLCDDYSDASSYGSMNCSKGVGHEKNNPEGHAVCTEEFKYGL